MEQLEKCVKGGEPLIRYMAYEFPMEGVEEIIDQFMLGDKYLVAPVYEKGKMGREVYIPKGTWIYDKKEIISDGKREFFESKAGVPIVLEKKNRGS